MKSNSGTGNSMGETPFTGPTLPCPEASGEQEESQRRRGEGGNRIRTFGTGSSCTGEFYSKCSGSEVSVSACLLFVKAWVWHGTLCSGPQLWSQTASV